MTNTWAQFAGPNVFQAREVLSYQQHGYKYTQAHRRGGWDGTVYLMRAKGRFAAGLVPWLVDRLAREGIRVEVDDQRPEPLPQDTHLAKLRSTTDFRIHQRNAIEQALDQERGVVHHPTAAGKTEIMIALTECIGRPALVLVHRKDLMYQAAERFMKTLGCGKETVGIVGDGLWEPRVITIATFQTLYMRLKEGVTDVQNWLQKEIGQVHVDECHHLPARSYEKVMAQLWSARWRYGYSATPYKEADPETQFKVMAWLGPTVHQVGAEELAERGHLVPADVFMIRLKPSPVTYKDWPMAVQGGIVDNYARNDMIVRLARELPKPVVILVERLAHGEYLARELGTQFVAGNASTSTRQTAWSALRQGVLQVLVASRIADEGLDIPQIRSLILAGGGKAPHLTVQRIGRGMRVAGGKERIFCFDFLDRGKWLGAHAKRRLQTYNEQPAYTVAEVDIEEVLGT
jgi:superfamily II DNA or RNA helicase